MEGDFSWLWRNEELSDFTLIIREVPRPEHGSAEEAAAAATGAADAAEAGIQTRSGKRRRMNASAADAAGPSTRRRAAQQQQQTPPAAAGPSTRAGQASAQQQQQADHPQEQQQEGLQGQQMQAAAAAGAQQARGRSTRRSSRQQPQQQDLGQQQQAQQQEEQHAPAAAAAAATGAGTPVGRRTRRSSANRSAQQPVEPAAAAAAAGSAQEGPLPDNAAAAAAAADAGADAEHLQAAGGPVAPPSSRKTRSTRGKKRGAEATAAAAAAGAPIARTRAVQQQQQEQQAQQQQQDQQQQQQQRQSDEGGPPPARRSNRRQQVMQQLQQSMQQLTTGSDSGNPQDAAAADVQQQQQPAAAAAAGTGAAAAAAATAAVEIKVPVHAVVLAGFSEYFKALICSWSGNLNRQLTLDVGVDEGNAALLMVEFMYTGKLPDASPEELLKMIRLADQYQVTRFMAAASSSFELLPLSTITQGVMLEVFRLPQLMLDAPEMSRVLAKARSKLLDLYGDLEKVWACEALREQFLALPYPAVRCLLGSEATAVATENTALVALTGWVEEGAHGRGTTAAQRKELLSLVRLPYLTSSFVGDILLAVPWIRDTLDNRQLLNAFQFAIASESTRQRLASYDYGPSAVTPHFRCPRPTSSVSRATFEWSIELSTIKRMVSDAKLWGRVVELSSPLHYFAGFWWQLLFNVEKTPTPADAPPDVAAAASGTVVEFVGVRCHVNCGAHDYWPRVVRFKATIAALQTGFWEMDYAYMKAIEGPIVDGVGLGYPGFFALPGQALESEAAWSRFVRNGRVQLRCEVTDCE